MTNNQFNNVQAIAAILKEIFGAGVWDDSAEDTARRVLKYWIEMAPQAQMDFNFTVFPATANQLIVVKDIEFTSLCAHHLLPFQGYAHVAYIPNKQMVGLSKIPRVVDFFAHRPSTQETLTATIARFLKDRLEAHGVAVVMEARHTCMSCRGVHKAEASMVTSEMRGVFLTSAEARTEFMSAIARRVL